MEPLWEVRADEALEEGLSLRGMPPLWRVLLLGDGSVTRFFELTLLVGVGVRVVGERAAKGSTTIREVVLEGDDGSPLAHAVSEWDAADLREYVPVGSLPMWRSFSERKRELYRHVELVSGCIGKGATEKMGFPRDAYALARKYLLYNRGRPITRVQEVFSPGLASWLGDYHNHYL